MRTADPPAAAAENPEGFAAAVSTTAVTSTSPVSRFPVCACPEARTLTESFPSASKSVPSYASVRTATVPEVLLAPLIVTPPGALGSAKSFSSRLAAAT